MAPSPSSKSTNEVVYEGESPAESSRSVHEPDTPEEDVEPSDAEEELESDMEDGLEDGMDPAGFSGPQQPVVKPINPEELAAFKAAYERTGIVYISRIPPGMQPPKVRHFMSAYGEVGRVYLQQEDAKRAYLRKKYTSTKKPHFTEGWVEFKDKKVARAVADMLNAQPIGGKKGTRWRDDVWTMKYLPKFKWNMLTEQVAHENAVHTAKLRVELSHSRSQQQQYLRNVELARIVDKRAEKKREKGEELKMPERRKRENDGGEAKPSKAKRQKKEGASTHATQDREAALEGVLANVF